MRKKVRDDIVARADEAYGSSNYAEYSVEKEVKGKYKLARILIILLYIIFALLLSFLFIKINPYLIAIVPIIIWIIAFFTWRYFSIEYKYVIDKSKFSVFVVYGGKKEKLKIECFIKELELIAPYDDEYTNKVDISNNKLSDYRPSASREDVYFVYGKDISQNDVVVLFKMTNQMLKAFKYYNSTAVVISELSR